MLTSILYGPTKILSFRKLLSPPPAKPLGIQNFRRKIKLWTPGIEEMQPILKSLGSGGKVGGGGAVGGKVR